MNGLTWVASPAWAVAGWAMLHYLRAGAALAALAAAGRWVLRRSPPDVRYGYALASLTVLAVAPAVIALLLSRVTPEPNPRRLLAGGASPIRALDGLVAPSLGGASAVTPVTLRPGSQAAGASPIPRPARNGPGQVAQWTSAVAAILPAIWLVGAPLTFAYLATGLAGAERLRRRSRPLGDGDLTAMCNRLADGLGVAHRVAIGVCDRVSAPLLLGVVRPLILLPTAALSGWTPEQVEMALLHELTHVRRWDNLVNLLQRVTESALFFHPAVWVVSGWVRREREHCCDRVVVEHTGRAFGYAAALFALSESAAVAPVHGVSMAESYLVERIRCILSPEDRTMKLSRASVGLAAALLSLPVLLLGTYARQVEPLDQRGGRELERTNRVTARSARHVLRGAEKESIVGEESLVARPLTTLAEAQAKAGDGENAREKAPEVRRNDVPNRTLRRSGTHERLRRPRDPNVPPWQPGPIPATIPVRIAGVAQDEAGKAVPGATITLYSITDKGSKPLAKATTNAEGRYYAGMK
jgi:beta-lactamase regulating signal transducer with metallopeptidase domain